jgi:hypothetical protein
MMWGEVFLLAGRHARVAAERLYECSFLIPIRRDHLLSDGKPHRKRVWAWLEAGLVAFGGATRAPDLYEGWYFDPQTGQQVRDQSRKYFVALRRGQLDQLRGFLRLACREFQQKCIYLSVAGRVEFVEGGSDAPS